MTPFALCIIAAIAGAIFGLWLAAEYPDGFGGR